MRVLTQFIAPIRVMLVDDQPIVLWALQKLLHEQRREMDVVAVVSTPDEVLSRARACEPDVIVLDCALQAGAGAALIPQLVAELQANILLFTHTRDETVIDRAMLDGVRGMVHKDEPMERLLSAIDKIHAGELWIDRKTSSRLLSDLAQRRHARNVNGQEDKLRGLTPREQAILVAMARLPGARNKQLARHLDISEHTLRNHLSSMFGKLDLRTRYDLFSFACQHLPQEQRQLA